PTRTGRWRWSLSSAADRPGRRGLGRGLEVLMGGLAEGSAELAYLPIDDLHPNPRQPRRRFEAEAHQGLSDSIRVRGVVQPVLVRPRAAGGYELIAGERRWRAAREAGLTAVPAVVRAADDRDTLLLGLVENVAREALSPVEEARARTPYDPALAGRARSAAERLTGLPARVVGGRLEIAFAGDVQLDELVETLERAAAP